MSKMWIRMVCCMETTAHSTTTGEKMSDTTHPKSFLPTNCQATDLWIWFDEGNEHTCTDHKGTIEVKNENNR